MEIHWSEDVGTLAVLRPVCAVSNIRASLVMTLTSSISTAELNSAHCNCAIPCSEISENEFPCLKCRLLDIVFSTVWSCWCFVNCVSSRSPTFSAEPLAVCYPERGILSVPYCSSLCPSKGAVTVPWHTPACPPRRLCSLPITCASHLRPLG